MKKTLQLILFFCSVIIVQSQSVDTTVKKQSLQLSDEAEISLITCGPGAESYSTYGHSAYRIKDRLQGLDRVYNYGTFNFKDPNFEMNFLKGNTYYFLSAIDFRYFLRSYQQENRWMKEQILNLQPSDVQKTFDFLENNALPENRAYLYHYFFNNCSTQLLDAITHVLDKKLITSKFNFKETTHRKLIQLYLKDHPWSNFVSNLVLGAVIDENVTTREYIFLPDNLLTYFDSLKIIKNGVEKSLVIKKLTILPENNIAVKKSIFSPFLVLCLIGFVVFWYTLRNYRNQYRSRWLDFSIFFITGVIGCVIAFMWFFSNHISSVNNFNNLWAFAPNLPMSFFLLKKQLPKWFLKYILLLLILLIITAVAYIFNLQGFTIATLPILMFLGVRYYYLWNEMR